MNLQPTLKSEILLLRPLQVNDFDELYAFHHVKTAVFHIGNKNTRSQKATEKLGAVRVGQIEKNYPGESSRGVLVYHLTAETFSAKV